MAKHVFVGPCYYFGSFWNVLEIYTIIKNITNLRIRAHLFQEFITLFLFRQYTIRRVLGIGILCFLLQFTRYHDSQNCSQYSSPIGVTRPYSLSHSSFSGTLIHSAYTVYNTCQSNVRPKAHCSHIAHFVLVAVSLIISMHAM